MKIYKPLLANDYECLNCATIDDYEIFNEFDGSSRIDTWQPIKVRSYHPLDEWRKPKQSDFPWLGSDILVMRKRAVEALRDMVEAHGELLPLELEGGEELYALNARTVDALDESASEIVMAPDTGELMFVERAAFIAPKICSLDIFRLPYRAHPTYVSERFVERVKRAGLVGLEFDKVADIGPSRDKSEHSR